MAQDSSEASLRFLSHIDAADRTDDLFSGLHVEFDPDSESVAGLRRRRRRVANSPDSPIKLVSLVEEDGVLYWRDGIPAPEFGSARRRRRARARGEPPAREGAVVLAKEFLVLAPNQVIAALGKIDQRLNAAIDVSLRSRLRLLQGNNGNFTLGNVEVSGPFAGRTLLFVHGTFSNAKNMLDEFMVTPPGQRFLDDATSGAKKYDRVIFFEHATLSVSPVINALELGRAFAGSSGVIDVIAHSRGGLIVRWWLEAFGSSLLLGGGRPARVVFAGSPLHGTSLAAPDKLQNAMSLISNIGSFAEGGIL